MQRIENRGFPGIVEAEDVNAGACIEVLKAALKVKSLVTVGIPIIYCERLRAACLRWTEDSCVDIV